MCLLIKKYKKNVVVVIPSFTFEKEISPIPPLPYTVKYSVFVCFATKIMELEWDVWNSFKTVLLDILTYRYLVPM